MKLPVLFLFGVVCCLSVFGQDDYEKKEIFVGYSNGQYKDDFGEPRSFNGVTAAGVYNISRYFGIRGDFSGTYGKRDFTGSIMPGGSFTVRNRTYLYNFLGGLQVKDNASTKRLKPFGYALAGAGHSRFKSTSECSGTVICFGSFNGSRTGFAAAIGGGLDIKINKKIDFRAIQVDYNPIFLSGRAQHGARISIGIVFK